jgi:hypothetical protein
MIEGYDTDEPSYWASCLSKDFRGLREFIDQGLGQLGMEGHPASKNEFSALVDLLAQKNPRPELDPEVASIDKWDELSFEPFSPTSAVQTLLDQLEQCRKEMGSVFDEPNSRRRRKLRQRIEQLEKEAHQKTQSERVNHETKKQAIREAFGDWQTKSRIVANVMNRAKQAFSEGNMRMLNAERISWRLLPDGPQVFDQLVSEFQRVARSFPERQFDIERLDRLRGLNPSRYYIGEDEFEGYVVCTFTNTEKAVLECPFIGNAIYVLRSDWKALSRLSKRCLLNEFPDQVFRIPHAGDYWGKLRWEMHFK